MQTKSLAQVAALAAAVFAAVPGYTAPPPPAPPPPKATQPTDDSTANGNAIGSEAKKPMMPQAPSFQVAVPGTMSAPPLGPDGVKKPPPKAPEASA